MRGDIRLLGPVEVRVGERAVDLGPPKRRAVLALLALRRGRPTSIDDLVDFVWALHAPGAARRVVLVHLSRLREPLAEAGITLDRTTAGYVLDPDVEVDSHRFESAVAAAERDPGRRAELLRVALGEWRGDALAGIGDPPGRTAAVLALERLRITAWERLVTAELDAGRHAEVRDDLADLVARYPTHEAFATALMVAAYRSDRRADALREYDRLRRVLRDELGVTPGPTAEAVFRQVLRSDAALGRPGSPAPRMLPPDVDGLHGRDDDLARLDALADAGRLLLVSGMGGVGKTALAVRWAYRRAADFPDGQLFLNVHGYGGSEPVDGGRLLAMVLHATGTNPSAVPEGFEERLQACRAATAGRRVLLVVDNARDPDLLRTAAGAIPSGVVLATSRDRMNGLVALDGAGRLDLSPLDSGPARSLLAARLPVGEPGDGLDDLVALCGGLPLALRLAAAGYEPRRHTGVAAYAAGIRAAGPVTALAVDGDDRADPGAVFSWSYQRLTEPAARAFRLLGSQPIGVWSGLAAAAAVGLAPDAADPSLAELVDACLLDTSDGRYTMHDLLAAYATSLAAPAERDEAVVRVLSWYREAVLFAMERYLPADRDWRPAPGDRPVTPPDLPDADAALAWLADECDRLVALVRAADRHGAPQLGVDLLQSLQSYMHNTGRNETMAAICRAVEAAAEANGDRAALAMARHDLGRVALSTGRFDEAERLLRAALADRTDLRGRGATLNMLGMVLDRSGRAEESRAAREAALAVFEELGDVRAQAIAWNNLGNVLIDAVHGDEALAALDHARRLAGDDHPDVLRVVRYNLARLLVRELRFDEAAAEFREQLDQLRRQRIQPSVSHVLNQLAFVEICRDRLDEAESLLTESVEVARDVSEHNGETRAYWLLGKVALRRGRAAEARGRLDSAIELCRAAGMPMLAAEIGCDLAEALAATGELDAAEALAEECRAMAAAADEADTEAQAYAALGRVAYLRGRSGDAADRLRRALELAERSGRGEIARDIRARLAEVDPT